MFILLPASPELWDYLINAEDAVEAILHLKKRFVLSGTPMFPEYFHRMAGQNQFPPTEQHLVNVGSVGQPRDGNPMLAFGIFDSTAWEYELIRSTYDIQGAAEKILNAGLPRELGYRLMYGM